MIEASSHNDDKGDLARDESSLAQHEPSVATILQEERDHRQSDDLNRPKWRTELRNLYVGTDKRASRFQWAIASVDLVIVAFFIFSPVLQDTQAFLWIDYAVALLLILDLGARALAAQHPMHWLRRPVVWVDLIVLATLLAPLWLVNLGFLRILRLWTLSQNDLFWRSLRTRGYGEWEDVGRAAINLVTCLFLITGFVFTVFAHPGSGMEGWVDALYFSVATVTTTGFGDITLPGTLGKLTSIVTMIVGISLFVRLAQALFRPYKVSFRCPRCALLRHEPDAVHCKACGHLLAIPDTGEG
ncbi:potassium channel family protein [Tianweitania sp. BSSL-BM11]|uniref:Potassium channel family protein n=1 Tax=Tianweitania aestuarii TaxID=2814886 RepID=A0ABS5RY89_9HYPH|nr:potassium channel family protein [Tianweitania aestuarii]MBS9722016.1 potassium channel family protein [Tianweitania aestuarii]